MTHSELLDPFTTRMPINMPAGAFVSGRCWQASTAQGGHTCELGSEAGAAGGGSIDGQRGACACARDRGCAGGRCAHSRRVHACGCTAISSCKSTYSQKDCFVRNQLIQNMPRDELQSVRRANVSMSVRCVDSSGNKIAQRPT